MSQPTAQEAERMLVSLLEKKAADDSWIGSSVDMRVMKYLHVFFSLLPGKHVLDAGCRDGQTLAYALVSNADLHYRAIDPSPGMVARAQALNPHQAHWFSTMSVFAPTLRPESLDGVICLNSMTTLPMRHLPDTLSHYREALRPDGVLFLSVHRSVPSQERYVMSKQQDRVWCACYELTKLTALVAAAGFTVKFAADDPDGGHSTVIGIKHAPQPAHQPTWLN